MKGHSSFYGVRVTPVCYQQNIKSLKAAVYCVYSQYAYMWKHIVTA